jgi:hypothetical protein
MLFLISIVAVVIQHNIEIQSIRHYNKRFDCKLGGRFIWSAITFYILPPMKTYKFSLVLLSATTLLFAMVSCSDLPDINETPAGSSSSQDSSSSLEVVVSSSSVDASSSSAEAGSSSSSIVVLVEPSSSGTASDAPSSSSVVSSSSEAAISSSSTAPPAPSSSSVAVSSSSSETPSSSSLVTGKIWDGTADTTWYTSNKDKSAFLISTAEQLAGLALLVNGNGAVNGKYNMNGKTIRLNADIMLNDTTGWQDWEYESPANIWTPIGTNNNAFQGTFEGNKHVVSGFFYENDTSSNIGLFGSVNTSASATIKEIGVVAFYIYAKHYVGGLVGSLYSGSISNSYSRGIVKAKGGIAGGLVGYTYKKISNCYSTSTVYGITNSNNNYIGGLVGAVGNNTEITNSYSTGKVSKADGTWGRIGGLIGYNGAGTSTPVVITNSYYDKETSEQTDTGKGEPKTTAEMQTEEFAATLGAEFKYNPGGYPLLKWQ